MEDSVKEEQLTTSIKQKLENLTDLGVSRYGTWQKRGFSFFYGVSSLIGVLSKKLSTSTRNLLIVNNAKCGPPRGVPKCIMRGIFFTKTAANRIIKFQPAK